MFTHGIALKTTLVCLFQQTFFNMYMEQICKANGIDTNSKLQAHVPCTELKMSKDGSPSTITPEIRKQQDKFRSNVGAILFLARCTMPTLSFAVGRLGRFASNSGPPHWKEMQHLVKHIKTVRNAGLVYRRPPSNDPQSFRPQAIVSHWNNGKPNFRCYSDSDFAGCPDTSRSTSGAVITWMGAAIAWGASLQACVTLSTAEAEMVALCKLTQEVMWMRRFISELMGYELEFKSDLHCDNQATLKLVDKRVHHARTKHIKLRQNFVREQKDAQQVNPIHIATKDNLSDIFTKPLSRALQDRFWPSLTGSPAVYT